MSLRLGVGRLGGSKEGGEHSAVDDAHFDVTPLVDLVFMMNIFFMVTWLTTAMAEADLPTAQHCTATDADRAVVVTLLDDGPTASVHLGDTKGNTVGGEPDEQAQRVLAAVQAGQKEGKDTLLIKAEKKVHLRDVARVAAAVASIEGIKLRLGVIERE
jgi:biopolymer transport protein ExbD